MTSYFSAYKQRKQKQIFVGDRLRLLTPNDKLIEPQLISNQSEPIPNIFIEMFKSSKINFSSKKDEINFGSPEYLALKGQQESTFMQVSNFQTHTQSQFTTNNKNEKIAKLKQSINMTKKGAFMSPTNRTPKAGVPSAKDTVLVSQTITQILRGLFARLEDLNILGKVVDFKLRKVKMEGILVKKMLFEMEGREIQRINKENELLQRLQNAKFEEKIQRKALIKSCKKILRKYPKYEEDDTNHTKEVELHLNQIMGQKQSEKIPKSVKFFEAATKEKSLDVYFIMGLCVQCSRQSFIFELKSTVSIANDIEIGSNSTGYSTNSIMKLIRANTTLNDKVLPNSGQAIQGQERQKIINMMYERNTAVDKAIKTYCEDYKKKSLTPNMGVLLEEKKTVSTRGEGARTALPTIKSIIMSNGVKSQRYSPCSGASSSLSGQEDLKLPETPKNAIARRMSRPPTNSYDKPIYKFTRNVKLEPIKSAQEASQTFRRGSFSSINEYSGKNEISKAIMDLIPIKNSKMRKIVSSGGLRSPSITKITTDPLRPRKTTDEMALNTLGIQFKLNISYNEYLDDQIDNEIDSDIDIKHRMELWKDYMVRSNTNSVLIREKGSILREEVKKIRIHHERINTAKQKLLKQVNWKLLYSVSEKIRDTFKNQYEDDRFRILSFIFVKSIIKIQIYTKAFIKVRVKAAQKIQNFIKKKGRIYDDFHVEKKGFNFRLLNLLKKGFKSFKLEKKYIIRYMKKNTLTKIIKIQRFIRRILTKKHNYQLNLLKKDKKFQIINDLFKQKQNLHNLKNNYHTELMGYAIGKTIHQELIVKYQIYLKQSIYNKRKIYNDTNMRIIDKTIDGFEFNEMLNSHGVKAYVSKVLGVIEKYNPYLEAYKALGRYMEVMCVWYEEIIEKICSYVRGRLEMRWKGIRNSIEKKCMIEVIEELQKSR